MTKTNTYTFTQVTSIEIDIDDLSKVLIDTVWTYIEDNTEMEMDKIPSDLHSKIVKDCAKYILENF